MDNGDIRGPSVAKLGKQEWGFYVKDTWKVTGRLPLECGLRYDYSTYHEDQYGRFPTLSTTTPDPSAGGLPGAAIYEGSFSGRCNCSFAHNYLWAFGSRLGVACQIDPPPWFAEEAD